ncbi:hypothetical protein FQZ97_776450 [compost metagenome]
MAATAPARPTPPTPSLPAPDHGQLHHRRAVRRRHAGAACRAAGAAAAAAADRRQAGDRHHRAVAGHVHERARLVDRQRVDPGDLGRPRRGAEPGHLGHHLVRGGQCDLGAADRLADHALRRGAAVHHVDPAVRAGVVAVRRRAQPGDAAGRPGPAGGGGGADDPAVAVAAAVELSAREEHHGAGAVGHDHAGGAHHGPAAGRLDLRQHDVAVDLLHQRAGGDPHSLRHLGHLQGPRNADQGAADRPYRPGAAGDLGGVDAADARQGQGAGLVPLHRNRGADAGGHCRLPVLPGVGDL